MIVLFIFYERQINITYLLNKIENVEIYDYGIDKIFYQAREERIKRLWKKKVTCCGS